MVHVETVDLAARGIQFPSDRVGMVIAQPHVPIESLTGTEPYQLRPQARGQQLAALTRTLTVAKAASHGVPKTHFTVFPEYSIPGLAGVGLIDAAVAAGDWPSGSIVIGGTDALTRAQYADLLQTARTHVDAARHSADHVGADRWVNCAITWVKAADGTVERWIQPKLHPAWEEMNIEHQHMFPGRSVYMFRGRFENNAPFRFGTLVCFDWIATIAARRPFQWILNDLHEQANNGNQLPLSWLFIIQRNKRPSHDTFLNGVRSFFNQTEFPNALRERACLVFANTAGRSAPGRVSQFGACSVVASPQSLFVQPTCLPTFSSGGARFRDGSSLLANCKDVVFRERGACIHSFAQINPGSVPPGAAGRSFPVDNAHVFSISGAADPRAPDAAVPAAVKWLNDELDTVPSLSTLHQAAPLGPTADAVHQTNIIALRAISAQSATRVVTLATQGCAVEHADDWDAVESDALRHLVHSLDILSISFNQTTIASDTGHAVLTIQNQPVDLIAIRGATHEACIEHSKAFVGSPQRQTLLVSRDSDNIKWHRKFGSFLEPVTPHPGEERKITDPASGTLHLGYQNLLEIFLASVTAAQLGDAINAELAA